MAKVIYEHKIGDPIPPDAVDGMEDMLGDDMLETDWDINTEDPPIGFWKGTHTRDGKRIPGFTEEEYKAGAKDGDVMLDDEGKPIYAEAEKENDE